MKPLDPRLLRIAAPARRYVLLTTTLGLITAALVIAQALLVAHILAPVVDHTATLAEVTPLLRWLVAVLVVRIAVTWAQERFGQRAAVDVVATLREQVVTHAVLLGPRWLAQGRATDIATLTTRGLDDLQPYLLRYLPQLLLAATVTPATILVVLRLDWLSAVIVAVTLPLIPLFMVLIGRLTEGTSQRRLVAMRHLGSQVLDLLAGLPTLRALGREHGPQARVRSLGEAYRRTTMGTLRVAFLSGFVLELLATLSVAIVAVGVGLRLVDGGMTLTIGLAVLMLAPEVYLPLRQVGQQFHASVDGISAASAAFEVLETPLAERGTRPAPDMTGGTVRLRGVSVRAPGRDLVAPANVDAVFRPGEVTALRGPNGAGKTTAVHALLGLVSPDEGRVDLCPATGAALDLREVDPATWWSQVTWVDQRTQLVPGTILENVIATAAPGITAVVDAVATDAVDALSTASADYAGVVPPAVLAAARLTGLDEVVAGQTAGWHTRIGEGGVGLSLGQRQRIALTTALCSTAPFVVLDEPTAHLDAASARLVHATVQSLRSAGRTVVLVTHRQALLDECDSIVDVRSAVLMSDATGSLDAGGTTSLASLASRGARNA